MAHCQDNTIPPCIKHGTKGKICVHMQVNFCFCTFFMITANVAVAVKFDTSKNCIVQVNFDFSPIINVHVYVLLIL